MGAAVKPTFLRAQSHFRKIYGDGTLAHVSNTLGGKVQVNIDGEFFENACAIRMSYVLNKVGLSVPRMANQTVSGADSSQYIYKVKDLVAFLRLRLGASDLVIINPRAADFSGRKGILIFEVNGWRSAAGHATLWDGRSCIDSCYFPIASKAYLWELP